MPATIYALVDPRDEVVRWVGRTRNLHNRMLEHNCATSRRRNPALDTWLSELRALGMKPRAQVIRSCSFSDAPAAESAAIQTHAKTALNILRPLLTTWQSELARRDDLSLPSL